MKWIGSLCIGLLAVLALGAVVSADEAPPETPDSKPTLMEALRAFEQQHPEARVLSPDMTAPLLLKSVEVTLPEAAKTVDFQPGQIVIETVVDANGDISAAAVLHSDTPDLNEAALQSVHGRKYQPAMKDGKPISVFVTVVVKIELR